MKLISKTLIFLIFIFVILISYLSIYGIETDKFNNQISNKIKSIDEKIEVELKKIKLVLDPFKLKLDIKTVGSNFKNQDENIEIENIKTQISLKSLVENKFSIENLEISTKPLEIKKLISFLRSFKNSPELYILEKIVKKGFLIADIELEFDAEGKIKNNYKINGFIKDTKFNAFKKYNFQKLNLIFEYKKDDLYLNNIAFSLNDLNFLSDNISFKKIQNDFEIKGEINHKKLNIEENNLAIFIRPYLPKVEIEKLRFSSNNNFSFKVNKKFEINNFKLDSKVLIDDFTVINETNLKNFLPNMREKLNFFDHELSIKYTKDDLQLNGKGNIFIQDKEDTLTYSINRKSTNLDFKTSLKIENNPFKIDFLNYENDKALIQLEGSKNKKDEIFINLFSINENKDQIIIENLNLNKDLQITKLDLINLDYTDRENQKNQIRIFQKDNQHILNGSFFNANKLIDNLLSDNQDSTFFNINTKIKINIDEILLDAQNNLFDFNGNLSLKNKEIVKANLVGNFSDNKKLKFTINFSDNNKITTLYIDKAEPIVKRYKFIKGFDGGLLDYYSSKKSGESFSRLKIYDFKLKELPLLTKILTLASLQGIADILSGEGISFDEFEMNFRNKGNLMTIDEIYAIGPAISILMDGYIEKNKLISLRGTLVPATTINKFIGSLPVLGKILVGSKTGEGVFGVSFKIKGHPKKLETSVNPIKTLTPRFITRTLEKIKKN